MTTDPAAVLAAFTGQLRALCHAPDMALTADTPLREIPGIDSLRLLQAIAHLEDRFQVEIDLAALERPKSVADILDAVATARPAP